MAPVDGTVQGLKIHTSGAVVTTADTLMTIVPDGAGIRWRHACEIVAGNGGKKARSPGRARSKP